MKFAFIFFTVLILFSCEFETSDEVPKKRITNTNTERKQKKRMPNVSDTILYFGFKEEKYSIQIKAPKSKYRGTILVLQGWNFPRTSWCENSDLCTKALEEGYYLIMPEMGKSIYHWKTYSQTRKDWIKYPTRDWLVNDVCNSLRSEYDLMLRGHDNFVLGLSTGGRGALLIAQENPDIFKGAASISGDYDQSPYPTDNLYIGYFGKDPKEWNPQENPISFIDKWEVPMYIGHGNKDKVVSISHMSRLKLFVDSLRPDLNFRYHIAENAKHDYKYWSSEVANMLSFFRDLTQSDKVAVDIN